MHNSNVFILSDTVEVGDVLVYAVQHFSSGIAMLVVIIGLQSLNDLHLAYIQRSSVVLGI
jgi:hypothetical protein